MFVGQLALIVVAAFTGAAIYVSFAEQPARLGLDDRALLAEWKPSYKHGAAIQAPLALIGFVLGTIAWWQSGQWLWLAGAIAMIAPWPWTMVIIMPVNHRLEAMDPARDGAMSRPLLERWGQLHAVRSALGCLATLLYLLASLR